MTNIYNLFDGIDKAQDIGDMGHADQLRPGSQQARQQVQAKVPGIIHRKHLQRRALALAEQLPGHDVGVVLRLADDDLVAIPDKGFAKTERHQVEGRRSSGREDDFLAEFRVQVRPDGIARRFVLVRGQIGDPVHGAVEVGVVFLGHFRPLADDGTGALGRGRIVQIDKRFAIYLLPEFGKFLPYFFYLRHRELQI